MHHGRPCPHTRILWDSAYKLPALIVPPHPKAQEGARLTPVPLGKKQRRHSLASTVAAMAEPLPCKARMVEMPMGLRESAIPRKT